MTRSLHQARAALRAARVVGAVVAALGMSVVAVLVLRALGEWRQIEARERAGGS